MSGQPFAVGEIRPNVAEHKGEHPPSFGVGWFVKVDT